MQKAHSMLNFLIFLTTIVFFIYLFTFIDYTSLSRPQITRPEFKSFIKDIGHGQLDSDYNIWLIFTKVVEQSPLYFNFHQIIENILSVSSVSVHLHIITDDTSREIANGIFNNVDINHVNASKILSYDFYNVSDFASRIMDIVEAMTPFFSSKPGTYYSDALFYISLGLYRLAPSQQSKAVMIDCDAHFQGDITLLFDEFNFFSKTTLFALAPELSPVYKHILYTYKQKHNTTFGEYLHAKPIEKLNLEGIQHPRGFPGLNSGVVLFNFTALRQSAIFNKLITKEAVQNLVGKYHFRGHLGDQDYYTLLGFERPDLVLMLSCVFNRQLCTWWRDNGGYKDIFDKYFECNDDVVVMHGNCNTRIPAN